jgi:hypothetical protein
MRGSIAASRGRSGRFGGHAFAFTLLVYQFAFFNIILPGHTRGAVTVDGRETGECPLCCACKVHGDHSQNEPTSRDREHCALCDFAAHVTLPPVIHFTLPALGVLHLLPIPPPQTIVLPSLCFAHLCRGPPAGSSASSQLI